MLVFLVSILFNLNLCGLILDNVEKVKDVLGKWGKMAAEASKKAEDMAGNMWQHCEFVFVSVI